MNYRDILLEGTAAEDADRMGLERKPGFGNYGPPGSDDVTHRSRGGKLVPVADTKGQGVGRGAGKAKPSGKEPDRRPEPSRPRPTPPVSPSTPKKQASPKRVAPMPNPPQRPSSAKVQTTAAERKGRADAAGGARKLGALLDVIPKMGFEETAKGIYKDGMSGLQYKNKIQEMLGTSPESYAVYDTVRPGPEYQNSEMMANLRGESWGLGEFRSTERTIWLHPLYRADRIASLTTPRSEWTFRMTIANHVLSHECVHSCSPRLREALVTRNQVQSDGTIRRTRGNLVMQSPDTFAMEEGLTEFIARSITNNAFTKNGVDPEHMKSPDAKAYQPWVRAVKWMTLYGGLDPLATFKNVSDVDEFRSTFQTSEDVALRDLFERELGMDAQELATMMDSIHTYERRSHPDITQKRDPFWGNTVDVKTQKHLAIANELFQKELTKLLKVARDGRYEDLPLDLVNTLLQPLQYYSY